MRCRPCLGWLCAGVFRPLQLSCAHPHFVCFVKKLCSFSSLMSTFAPKSGTPTLAKPPANTSLMLPWANATAAAAPVPRLGVPTAPPPAPSKRQRHASEWRRGLALLPVLPVLLRAVRARPCLSGPSKRATRAQPVRALASSPGRRQAQILWTRPLAYRAELRQRPESQPEKPPTARRDLSHNLPGLGADYVSFVTVKCS